MPNDEFLPDATDQRELRRMRDKLDNIRAGPGIQIVNRPEGLVISAKIPKPPPRQDPLLPVTVYLVSPAEGGGVYNIKRVKPDATAALDPTEDLAVGETEDELAIGIYFQECGLGTHRLMTHDGSDGYGTGETECLGVPIGRTEATDETPSKLVYALVEANPKAEFPAQWGPTSTESWRRDQVPDGDRKGDGSVQVTVVTQCDIGLPGTQGEITVKNTLLTFDASGRLCGINSAIDGSFPVVLGGVLPFIAKPQGVNGTFTFGSNTVSISDGVIVDVA